MNHKEKPALTLKRRIRPLAVQVSVFCDIQSDGGSVMLFLCCRCGQDLEVVRRAIKTVLSALI